MTSSPHIQNAGSMAAAHFFHIREIFSSLSPVPAHFFPPHRRRRHHGTSTFPSYSRDIFFIVPRTWEIFPPTFKTQTQWHWHISLIFSEYIIYCVPCPRNLAPRIQNAGTMARAHFPNILEVFSSLSPVPGKSFFPHPKRRHFCTDTFPPYSRHIIFIFSRTHEIFCPHPKRRHHGTSISLDYSRNILSTVSRTHEFFPPTSHIQKDRLTANAGVVVGDLG